MSFYLDQTVALVLRGSNAKPPELEITSNGKLSSISETEKEDIMGRFEKWLEDCVSFPRVHTTNSPVVLRDFSDGQFLMHDFKKFSKLFGKREGSIMIFDKFEAAYLQLSSHVSIICNGKHLSCREVFSELLNASSMARAQLMFWLFRANYKLAASTATVKINQHRILNIPKMIKANRKPDEGGSSTLRGKTSLGQKGRPPRGWFEESWSPSEPGRNQGDILRRLYHSGRYSLELKDVYGKWRDWKEKRQIKLEELRKAHDISKIKPVKQFHLSCLETKTVSAHQVPFIQSVIPSESSQAASPVVICKRGTKQKPWANDNKVEHVINYFTPHELVPNSTFLSNNICAVVEGRNALFFKFSDTELPSPNDFVKK